MGTVGEVRCLMSMSSSTISNGVQNATLIDGVQTEVFSTITRRGGDRPGDGVLVRGDTVVVNKACGVRHHQNNTHQVGTIAGLDERIANDLNVSRRGRNTLNDSPGCHILESQPEEIV